jgi:hypothetical protein
MKLKNGLIYSIFIICACLVTSCATTTISNVWKDEAYEGKTQKIVVIMVAKNPQIRRMFEGRFVAELESRGKDAMQSYKIVTMEELRDRDLVKSRIKATGADTVIISRLVGSRASEAYMPVQVRAVPGLYYNWGTYYDNLLVDYGYADHVQISSVETNLYDIKTEKLIWSALSKTERTEGEQQLINTFIDKILRRMSKDNII